MQIGVLALALLVAASAASGKTINTGVNGSDFAGCGSSAAPCRTISWALFEAAPGDTVQVGPGVYGDVNGDGDFDDPGEEPAQPIGGCFCVVPIQRRVTLRSRDGAGVTIIDAGKSEGAVLQVGTGADGTTIGGPQNGFTLRHSLDAGLSVTFAQHTRILGNVATDNGGSGFQVYGDGAVVTGNRSTGNQISGFELGSDGLVASGNLAESNGEHGFFVVNSSAKIENSSAIGNAMGGFYADMAQLELESDVAIRNGLYGVYFDGTSDGRVTTSTLMGNGVKTAIPCGIDNASHHELDARGNYWGSADGPGNGGADIVCQVDGDSNVVRDPFKKTEPKHPPKPLR